MDNENISHFVLARWEDQVLAVDVLNGESDAEGCRGLELLCDEHFDTPIAAMIEARERFPQLIK